jgi:hypothetical protein
MIKTNFYASDSRGELVKQLSISGESLDLITFTQVGYDEGNQRLGVVTMVTEVTLKNVIKQALTK